jgi:hypothetical protein
VPDGLEPSDVHEPLLPLQGGQFHGSPGFPGCPAVNPLGFVQPVDGLVPTYDSEQILSLRARYQLSQAVLASLLNTSLSTVRQWELGDKHPSGPSQKLLNLLERKGMEALI